MFNLLKKVWLFASVLLSTSASCGYDDGIKALQHGDYETALQEFWSAAEQGDIDAQFVLFGMYARSDGVEEDFDEATYWLTQAAEQGH